MTVYTKGWEPMFLSMARRGLLAKAPFGGHYIMAFFFQMISDHNDFQVSIWLSQHFHNPLFQAHLHAGALA